MRILLADKLPDHARVRLASGGHEVRAAPSLSGDTLKDALQDFDPDVLVVRSTKVTAEHLTAAHALSLVIRAGAGVNTIDVTVASAQGVYVANCPGKNAVAVAELTFGLILAVDRNIADGVIDLRAGQWNKGKHGKSMGLRGRTLGILGTGMIGAEVARLGNAFGMEVLAWSEASRTHTPLNWAYAATTAPKMLPFEATCSPYTSPSPQRPPDSSARASSRS
jgi:D-3-phosphoglycerate dehydrogenase